MALIKHNLTDNSAFRIQNNAMRCDSCEKLFLHFVLQDETQPFFGYSFFIWFLTACKTGPDANLLFTFSVLPVWTDAMDRNWRVTKHHAFI